MLNSLQKIVLGGLAAALAASAAMSGAAAQSARQVMVLQGGTLIDGTGKEPITDAVVVVQGNRITAVGKRGQVRIPAGAKIVKTDNRTILPGLIDSHVHTQDFSLPIFLHYGVTTILSKVTDPAWAMAMRAGIKDGTIKGPRMYWTGGTIGGLANARGQEAWNMPATRTPEETVSFARTLVANGAEAININQSVGDAQLQALIAWSKETNIPLNGHVPNIRRAAELGYKHQEHFFMLGAALLDPQNKTRIGFVTEVDPEGLADPAKIPELVDFMVPRGVFINPTLVAQWTGVAPIGKQMAVETSAIAQDPDFAFVPQHVRTLWKNTPGDAHQGYATISEFLRQYIAKGGKVIVGTDAGYRTIPGYSEHFEMRMLADIGIPNMKIIQGATLWNAELMNVQKDVGSVEVGKLADFTIVEGDPLKDIKATMNIRMVIQDGKVMDTKLDGKWVNPLPAPFQSYFPESQGVITNVSPAIVRQGGQSVELTIDTTKFSANTAGFFENSIVRFDNVDLPTKYVGEGKYTATLDAGLLKKAPGLYPLYMLTPGLHGTISDGAAYVVIDTVDAPVKSVPVSYRTYAAAASRTYGPMPRSAPQGGQSLTMEIKGTKFEPGAIVRFDNVDLPTKFLSSTRLAATIDAKLLQRSPGSYVVYVVTPGLFGTVSRPAYFQVGFKNSKMVWTEPLDQK